ncbi:unnamed protein product [Lupinus luteus]|uniref:OVATE domain-containing protein n=1 Tax=Lupinus luteus TaxID=3873 RepID=A0AAV1WHR6_LUPLU
MPKKIQKSFQDYFSKIKNHHSQIHIPSKKWILSRIKSHSSHIHIPSKKWMLPSCNHSRTSSLVIDDNALDPSLSRKNVDKKDLEATLADIDRFLIENFKSLYIKDGEEIHDTKRVHDDEEQERHNHGRDSKQRPILLDEPPSNLSDYNRFFMKGDFFNPLIDRNSCDKATSSSTTSTTTTTIFDDSLSSVSHLAKDRDVDQTNPNCVVVLACSSNPYDDFHQSMQEMVEARLRNNEVVDWDFMEQLFFHYMNLNDKKSYKFILNAFVDLVATMRSHWETSETSETSDTESRAHSVSDTESRARSISDTESRAHSVRTYRSGSMETWKKNKDVQKKVNKTNIHVAELVYRAMSHVDGQKGVEKEFERALQDRVMEETKDKKNGVEAYVYGMRNKRNEKYEEFVTAREKEGFVAKLKEVEEWLYEDGEDETEGAYVAKLEELKTQGDPVEECYKEYIERGTVSDQFVSNDPKYENPVLLSGEIRKKAETVDRFSKPIMTKPKPAMAATPPPEGDANGNTDENAGATSSKENEERDRGCGKK